MASTPEHRVKAKIHKWLKESGAYAVNYIGWQYANNGTPDILACLQGRFFGIEAKAGRGKPTALQLINLRKIDEAGGVALVINEKNLPMLRLMLLSPSTAESNYKEWTKDEDTDVRCGDVLQPRVQPNQDHN